MRIGLLHSLIRRDEKLLIEAFQTMPEVDLELLDDRGLHFQPGSDLFHLDAVLLRSVSHSRNLEIARIMEHAGIPCINPSRTVAVCGDKLATSLALIKAGVPHPELRVAFTPASALDALEEMGYPAVVKPIDGSWGRMVSKLNDRDAAEAVLEHKDKLGSYQHGIYYLQKYIEKGNRDIRAFVVGDACIAAITRVGNHWRTNTALGAVAENLPVTPDLEDIAVAAAEAVQGDIIAVDLFETRDGLVVNEVNDVMEFKNSVTVTGVDIHRLVCEHVRDLTAEHRLLSMACA